MSSITKYSYQKIKIILNAYIFRYKLNISYKIIFIL